MNTNNEYFATILLGCLAFVKTQICDLNCGPGYRCALRLSTCDYPPCPSFPTCAMTTPQPQGHASLMFGGRHSNSSYRHQHRRRHYSHHSLIESVSSNGLPAWGLANTERPGRCPTSTPTGPCINSCRIDSDCPQHQKCCENDCGRTCRTTINNATRKPGTCARRLSHVTGSCQRECDVDSDCLGLKKCCTTSCGAICSDPCYYWLQPNQRSNNWKLPFICRY